MSENFILRVDTVNAVLRAFVMLILDLPDNYVIIETRARPRPYDDRPYVTIYWAEQEVLPQYEGDFSQPTNELEEGTELLNNASRCTVRITVRGDNAYNLCSELRYALDSKNRNWDLYNLVGFSGATSVVDLSAVYGAQVQQRAFIDFSFYAAFGRAYPLAWFKEVPFIFSVLNEQIKTVLPKEKEPCP